MKVGAERYNEAFFISRDYVDPGTGKVLVVYHYYYYSFIRPSEE